MPADAHPFVAGIPLVLGGNVFGWTIDRDASFAVLDAFFEAGGRMIDTADGYSNWVPGNQGGESEQIIGEWLENRGVRAEIRIATKTGQGGAPGSLKRGTVSAALQCSLERLRTDYVDLYYAHRDDLVTPLDEVVDVYHEAFSAGRARELGASNYSAERLAEIIETAERRQARPFSVVQPLFNLVERQEFYGPLQELSLAKGLAVLPYYGLASGFLTGKFHSAADWQGSSRAHALDHAASIGGWAVLEELRRAAAETGAQPAQLALSWLNKQPGVAAPIASATSPEQVAQLARAAVMDMDDRLAERLAAAASN